MQLKSLLGFTMMVGAAFASSADKLDAKPMVDALGTISKSIQGLTTTVSAFDGDAAKGAALLTQANDLVTVIRATSGKISPMAQLSIAEALPMVTPGTALIADIQKVVDALISKKPAFDQAKLSPTVKITMQKIKTESESLLKVVTTKLPSLAASVGDGILKSIVTAIDKGLAAFS